MTPSSIFAGDDGRGPFQLRPPALCSVRIFREGHLLLQVITPAQTQQLLRRPQGQPRLSPVLEHLSRKVVREGVPPARQGLVGHGRGLSSHRALGMQLLATWTLRRGGQA